MLDMILFKTSGDPEAFPPSNGTSYSLKELQTAVDGFIELVHLDSQQVLVVNEDGLRLRLPVNDKASDIAGRLIVGDSLLCPVESIE